ncbi:PREDICTED: condensin complex subunit 3 isoform X2 [Papilio xuthus]|uniref:Condensin complex subunit 3 isoform X2 n=1 Tax=Papilio xuthus TaxID=66420 RepID=A0AAJ6Z9J7_PAPXU|nr:PREDICTED: condensin complex subunit 3 isoform X2 [Papilio xuthus]
MAPSDPQIPQTIQVCPTPNPRNIPVMFKIFQNVQYNVVQHKKYVKEMTKLYKKTEQDAFRESFRNALQYLFTFGDTSANVDRVIQFVATFCTSLDDEEEFLMFIFDIIFDFQCVSGQAVRYRASQLLAAVLAALGNDASLDDDLCDKLLASQMQRLQDTRGAVRCRAGLALQRLQNPMDPDDEVTRAYRFHMSCDPSSSVRRAIVMSIAKCTRNVPFVLERLCDVDEAVRRAAFLYISAMNVTQLRVRQRVLTLKVGLTERSIRVRRVVEEILIPAWLSSFEGNIVHLLKAIRLDNALDAKDSQYVAGKLLESLFKRLPISELLEWLPTDKTLRLIPAEKLNKETAWYWRHLAEHLQSIDDDETLQTVLPDLVVLTGYIRAIVESPCPSESEDPVGFSTRQYVLQELGLMLRVYDVSDPAGRTSLQDLIADVLTGDYGPLNPEVLRAFVMALELVVPDVSARMEAINTMISALRDPEEVEVSPVPLPPAMESTEVKLQRARLRVSLNVAMEAQEEAVREQNYALAAECKAKVEDIQKKLEDLNIQPAPPPPPILPTIKESKSDEATLNKCLIILNAALDTPQLTTLTPILRMIFKDLEVEIFKNIEIQINALETVALYAMLDKEFAKEYKSFFFAKLIDTSNEPLVTTALRCVMDLLCVHGVTVFDDEADAAKEDSRMKKRRTTNRTIEDTEDEESISESVLCLSPTHSTVIKVLLQLMDSSCASFRLIIVEGFCRLIHLGHLESPSILSRLLLLWFNPATADEDMLRQIIGVFFQTYPISVDGAQEQIQKATLPTLRALANAPSSSPIAEIDQEAVVRFIVSLTRVNHELIDSQGGMAVTLCGALSRCPTRPEAPLACRVLALLSPPRDAQVAADLANTLRDLITNLTEKQSTRNLIRYLGSLEAMERSSLNKISTTVASEGTLQVEDSLTQTRRTTTSLPQPIGRSTHVIINETVEEEPEIDETSPTEMPSKISHEPEHTNMSIQSSKKSTECDTAAADPDEVHSDSSGVSPVKKPKVVKGKKKKSTNKKTEKSETEKKTRTKKKTSKEQEEGKETEKGIKRTRSQRSIEDVDRAKQQVSKGKKKTLAKSPSLSPADDQERCNVSVRRTRDTRSSTSTSPPSSGEKSNGSEKKQENKTGNQGKGSTRSSAGSSQDSLFEDSADETQLHTIVYDKEIVQSLLEDSSELIDAKQKSGNVTIPETPSGSDDSDSEPEPVPIKGKGKTKGRKK